jgi:hypothetical protein
MVKAIFFWQSPRACSQSSQPDKSEREMSERQERGCKFVVTRGDASELLETCKEALDQIASAIEMPVEVSGRQTIGSGWNHRFAPPCFDLGDEVIGIVALVGHYGLPFSLSSSFSRLASDTSIPPNRERHL